MNNPFLEIKTYKGLSKYIKAFQEKKIGLLIIVSSAGLGKTTLVETELEIEAPLLLNHFITPLKFYQLLMEKNEEETDCLVIIDEAELMFQDTKLKAMLKTLCDTKEEKIIRYSSTSPLMRDFSPEFTTQAKVVMLINTLRPADEHIKAIMSRGHLIYFNPSDNEILAYLKTFADDKEIIAFIEEFAPFSNSLNLRSYVKAKESKNSKLNWRIEIIKELGIDERYLELKDLLERFKTDKERLECWKNSRSAYYRFKKLFLKKNPNYEKCEIK